MNISSIETRLYHIPLMVDANMRWTVDEAIRASLALAEYDVYWLEEPTIPDDVDGHCRIERESDNVDRGTILIETTDRGPASR